MPSGVYVDVRIATADDVVAPVDPGDIGKALVRNSMGKYEHAGVVSTDAANVFTRKQTFHAAITDVTLGSELAVDGTFPTLENWNDDSSGFNALNPGLTHNTGATGTLSQAVTIDTDNVYLLEISVTNMNAGWIEVYDDNNLDCYTEANGIIRSMEYTPTGADTIYINVSDDFDGTLEYVSLKASVDGSFPIGYPADLVLTDADGNPVCLIRSTAGGGFCAGYAAGRFAKASIVAIGDNTLDSITIEDGNVGIGPGAGQGAKCYNSLFVGPGTGQGETRDAYAHVGINGDWISGQTASGDIASQTMQLHAATITLGNDHLRIGDEGGDPTFGVYGATPVLRPTVTGDKGGNEALASLITALASLGLISDATT